ncbi:FBD-associated F-box protein At1g66310 [Linum grandiflorum]
MAIPNPNKRIRAEEEAGEGIDRLSSLPDEILTHIISLMEDPKASVQTSALATRWRHLWKQVPRLIIDSESFTVSTFPRYIDDLLSSRSDDSSVDELWFFLSGFQLDEHLFDKVLKYSASHGLQHLLFVGNGSYDDVVKADSIGLISNNLKSLLLEIVAPKLKSFDYSDEWNSPTLFNLSLPLLDHAELCLPEIAIAENNKKEMADSFVSLLRGLRNASSLYLYNSFFQVLTENYEFLANQACPFTRLKSLQVQTYFGSVPLVVPYQVMSYFLNRSSSNEPRYIEFVPYKN